MTKSGKQCKAKTKSGRRCTNSPLIGGEHCFQHDPASAKKRTAARRKGGYASASPKATADSKPIEIKAVDDVLALVNAVIADTWLQENTAARSRALLSAADMALKALQIGELEARVVALESAQNV